MLNETELVKCVCFSIRVILLKKKSSSYISTIGLVETGSGVVTREVDLDFILMPTETSLRNSNLI